jgi:transposase InsO family protein
VHLSIDDRSRVSFAAFKLDETAASCVQFLREAGAYYAGLGVRIDRVMTDNGAGYKNAFRAACDEMEMGYVRTRPYTPKTNGKAERLVQTRLREWAYARAYESSEKRLAAM